MYKYFIGISRRSAQKIWLTVQEKSVSYLLLSALLFSASQSSLSQAESAANHNSEWDNFGKLSTDIRYFLESPSNSNQLSHWQPSIQGEYEFNWQRSDNRRQFRFKPYIRLDGQDSERSHLDIRELFFRFIENDWQLTVGINKVFWGVTESRHLIDIINQDDVLDDIDGEDKLGQLMLNLNYRQDWGTLEAFLLPHFRERSFPGSKGRLRASQIISDNARYESSAEQWRGDIALRYAHTVGDLDFAAYLFHGTAREAQLIKDNQLNQLIPYYQIIQQQGFELQYTHDAWLWKIESIRRQGQEKSFNAMVAGFEYTYYQLNESTFDLGILIEYLHDNRGDQAPATTLQKDVFLGFRLAANDTQNSTLLAGSIVDIDSNESIFFAELESRLSASWFMEIEGRFFINSKNHSPIENDSFITLRVKKYI